MTAIRIGPWQQLHSMDTCLIEEIPRTAIPHPTASGLFDDLRGQRLAALVSAYHSAGPDTGAIVLGWSRPAADRPLDVFVGGSALVGDPAESGTDTALLSLPAGARARLQDRGAVAGALDAFPYWTAISGITDGLLMDDQPRDQVSSLIRPTLEDCLLSVWQGPFAWLVFAEPVAAGVIGELINDAADRQHSAEVTSIIAPEYAVEVTRLKRHQRELAKASSRGLWRIRLLAGGHTPHAASRVASLVCSSADLEGLPYVLKPHGETAGLSSVMDHNVGFDASSDLLAALARPPIREVPGVRFALRPEFDVTPENRPGAAKPGQSPVRLGSVLDRNLNPVGDFSLPRSSLNRHTFVCGATGGGKSQTVRGLLEAASRERLPWLVVEPAKAEYRFMSARLGDEGEVIVIKPGELDALPAGLNPLEPSVYGDGERFPLQTHLDMVRALFLASFDPQEPFPQVLSAALTRVYEDLGWDLTLGEPRFPGTAPRYPTLEDLEDTAVKVVSEIGYGKEITSNVRGFIKLRLTSLRLGTTGRFFEGGHPIDFGELLRRNVVFEIEDVGDDKDKAFLMGTVLIRLVEYLRMEQRTTRRLAFPLRHLTVFEEAHRLLRRSHSSGASAHAVEMFAGLLAEIRAYGEGLVIAEQIPSKLVPDVIKNTAAKIVHRLPARDDREAVGATMNITQSQSDYLVTLKPGEAAVFTDGMDYPLLVRMEDGTEREDGAAVWPASPAPLVTPRSRACGKECGTVPCTLRQLRTAQHLTEQQELRIALWAEMSVAAHMLGWTTPLPGDVMRRSLQPLWTGDRRLVECAIGQAVDRAVADRGSAIGEPAPFAGHIAEMMRAQLDGDDPCPVGEPRWKARKGTKTRQYYHGRYTPSNLEKITGCQDPSEEWSQRFAAALKAFSRPIRKPRPNPDTELTGTSEPQPEAG
ncbi:ATP-binding protein [Streptomyces sp. NPDC006512]|uniref:ATP-binding protein n=1 Tax=Streptomyces sp. NPDC006512 TaxID=3154307 RepID=UPI0033B5C7F8